MESSSKSNLLETVDTAIEYSAKLEKNLNLVVKAEQQIIGTAEKSLNEIDSAFDELTRSLLDALEKRREAFKKKVSEIEEEGLAPLKACKDVIKQTLKSTQNYICEGQDLLDSVESNQVDIQRCLKYMDQSSLLGSLPAVPNMEEVPCITFHLNVDTLRSGLVSQVLSAGIVYKMGPVQITAVTEKPGALMVEWEEVEDRGLDDQCFRLQLATGSHPSPLAGTSNTLFRTVYEGVETCCMVRDLRVCTPYTLRVSCCEQYGDWCAWSLPRTAITTKPPFQWSPINPHYTTSVEGKIATKIGKAKTVLLSNAKQFGPDHSIEFTVLECPENRDSDDGVGLVDVEAQASNTLAQSGCLFLNAYGCIFVDGVEKTTRLPPLVKGARVTFTSEPLSSSRVRVHIDSGEKAVTYDWRVACTSLHFAALCTFPGWKLMVE